jgi:hypothetical protein
MRTISSRTLALVLALALALALATSACSSSSTAADASNAFVGRWTYQPGSAIVVDCPSTPETTMDLSKVPPSNQPGFFSFSTSGSGLHEVDARGCAYDWTIVGDVASAAPGQSCATFPDGRGGNRLVHLQSGTKSTSDGATMTVDVHFTADDAAGCTIHVQGAAKKS